MLRFTPILQFMYFLRFKIIVQKWYSLRHDLGVGKPVQIVFCISPLTVLKPQPTTPASGISSRRLPRWQRRRRTGGLPIWAPAFSRDSCWWPPDALSPPTSPFPPETSSRRGPPSALTSRRRADGLPIWALLASCCPSGRWPPPALPRFGPASLPS